MTENITIAEKIKSIKQTKCVIYGAGGLGSELHWLLHRKNIGDISFIDDYKEDYSFCTKRLYKYIEGFDSTVSIYIAIGDIVSRELLQDKLHQHGFFNFPNLIDNNSIVDGCKFNGGGNIIFPNVVATSLVSIGSFVLINPGCTISHRTQIGNFVSLSPGVHVAGDVIIEDCVFIGTGASINPKIRIGKGAVIGSGACVVKDVDPFSIVAGIPAKKISHIGEV